MSDTGWTKEQIKQYDALALEDYSYVATDEERRYKKSWKISLNKEETQGPTEQCPDFREATQKRKRLYDEYVERTGERNRPIPPAQQIRQRREQQFECLDDMITQLILEQDGDCTLHPDQHLRLRPHTGSSTTIGSRIKVGILGELRPGLKSNFLFFFFFQRCHFACWKFNLLAIDRGGVD